MEMKTFIKSTIMIAALSTIVLTGCDKDDLPKIRTEISADNDIYGVVEDTDGNRLAGVTVSDGYHCSVTDQNGVYQLKRGEFSYQVFVSVPSDCKIPIEEGQPHFWKQLSESQKRYDFTLEKLPAVEESFNLFCIADPQCQNNTHVSRYMNETVPDIVAKVNASELPSYGMTLGDIGYNTYNNDYTNAVFPLMKIALSTDKNAGMPIFKVMGNHDYKVLNVKKADYTVAHDIKVQRNFEYTFGPVNYSFNRGKVHIIGMDDMIFPNHDDYSLGFRDDQVEWLRQDLANVPKDRMIIFCVHVPLRASTNQNVQAVLDLLREYSSVHVMSGHTHYAENDEYTTHYEHVHGAACGAWWHSTINTDGTPNGYAVYKVEGNKITDWTYKATGEDDNFQLRLYKGQDVFFEGYKPSYQFYYNTDKDLVANVWNADSAWKLTVYENGTATGTMELFGNETKGKCRDAWASGYHCGVQGRGANYDRTGNSHMYHYTLKNPSAAVKVVATDRFGKTFEQDYITTNKVEDYPDKF